jgi:outer membrane protein OmpA-like peptidoglycan-associated protein
MRIVTVIAAVGICAAPAIAAAEPSSLYLGGAAHYFVSDNDSGAGNGAGAGVFIGSPTPLFSGRGSIELGGFFANLGREDTTPGYSVAGGELLLRALLAEQARYSSFMIAGIGYWRDDLGSGDSRGYLTGGLGTIHPLGDRGWYLRGELRMLASRVDAPSGQTSGQDLAFDYRAALGLEYSFLDAAYASSASAKPPVSAPPAPAAAAPVAPAAPVASRARAVAPPPTLDSDGDGIPDASDHCPGTVPSAAVDPQGCPLPVPSQDSDGDGVPDERDRCAGTPKDAAVDSMGCSLVHDADGDGIADERDECPATPPGLAVDLRGCPPKGAVADADGDGVSDTLDRCPATRAGVSVDAFGCPLAGGDADGDGVGDDQDRCPGTKPGARVDARGCALAPPSTAFEPVLFAAGSADLSDDARRALDDIAGQLRSQPDLSLEIGGHADDAGSQSRNLELSQRRAGAVRDYLVARGVDASRLRAEGYGPFSPAADRARNNRVEFRIRR